MFACCEIMYALFVVMADVQLFLVLHVSVYNRYLVAYDSHE